MHTRSLALGLAAVLAVGCSDQGTPTSLIESPEFAKGGTPGPPPDGGPPNRAEYTFVYDFTDDRDGSFSGALGSDCVKKSPESPEDGLLGYGKTFWCSGATPTFKLQVVDSSDPSIPVSEGFVTFSRCEADGVVYDWAKCGVKQRGKPKYMGVQFGEPVSVNSSGVAEVTLTGWIPGSSVWGTHWEYDKGDGGKPEASIKWRDLACVGYRNPPGGALTQCQ